ncbi:MAG: polyprenyl synthetase family protein [Candidatus Bathyarchaeota archaeon]|nr:polyprenyl synthetase family protein [Candidatus Bathyarchaeota archaeon]
MQANKFELVESTLNRYKELTLHAMQPFLQSKEPRRYLYDLVPCYPERGGKGLRPGLCIATCRAFGGSTYSAVKSAVALELFHNAFLVHDDVEDESEFRRGKPTMNSAHGVPLAVNLGDAMNLLAITSLKQNLSIIGPKMTWQVLAEIEHMTRQSVEGQAMELGWVRDNICSLKDEDYLRMTLKKTCWYTCIHPCRIGGLIGNGGSSGLDRFNRFGYFMGAAFQIQDDILNLIGVQQKYGKEIGGDIWEGKRTLMLIHLLNSCSKSEREKLVAFLAIPRQQRKRKQVNWVYRLMSQYGSIEYGRQSALQLAEEALKEFDVAYSEAPDSEDKRFIRQIVEYMVERDI